MLKFVVNIKIAYMFIVICLGVYYFSKTNQTYNDFKKAVLNKEGIIYNEILFFHSTKKNTLGYASAYEVRREFLNGKEFKNCNLDSLLNEVIRGGYMINCEKSIPFGCFELSSIILNNYDSQSFDLFLATYLTDKKNMVKEQLSQNDKLTVIYLLFLNGYYARYDDYHNSYYVTKGIKEPIIENVVISPVKRSQ